MLLVVLKIHDGPRVSSAPGCMVAVILLIFTDILCFANHHRNKESQIEVWLQARMAFCGLRQSYMLKGMMEPPGEEQPFLNVIFLLWKW